MKKTIILLMLFPLLLACSSKDDTIIEEGILAEETTRTPDGNYPIAIDNVSAEEFAGYFENQYWALSGDVTVIYADGTTKKQGMVIGDKGLYFGTFGNNTIWEYYFSDFEPYKQINKGTYQYDAASHTLSLHGDIHKLSYEGMDEDIQDQELILVSINKEKMYVLGPVFSKTWYPEAVYCLYAFEHFAESTENWNEREWMKSVFGEENFPF